MRSMLKLAPLVALIAAATSTASPAEAKSSKICIAGFCVSVPNSGHSKSTGSKSSQSGAGAGNTGNTANTVSTASTSKPQSTSQTSLHQNVPTTVMTYWTPCNSSCPIGYAPVETRSCSKANGGGFTTKCVPTGGGGGVGQ